MKTKNCRECKKELSISLFHKRKDSKDGYVNICKNCKREYDKIHRIKNRDRLDKIGKKWYNNNKQEKNKQSREWYRNNKEHHNELTRKYYRNHREKRIKELNKYNKNHPEIRKMIDKRSKAKRKRNLKWIPLFENPFPQEIEVDYHHINDILVIPVPRRMHQRNLGKYHKNNMEIVLKKLYGLDLKKILGG